MNCPGRKGLPSTRECEDVYRLAVRVDHDCAIAIGSENLSTHFFVALQHFRDGMAEVVPAAGAHDRNGWRQCSNELDRARRQTAVVGVFQVYNRVGWVVGM